MAEGEEKRRAGGVRRKEEANFSQQLVKTDLKE